MFRLLTAALALILGGCAITPKNMAGCNFVRRELAVSDPVALQRNDTLAADVQRSLNTHRPFRPATERRGSMLFMSGGGQHGAFRAGFLQGWKDKRQGKLPEFSVVTGISTGALLSTFAFVNQPEATVRGYSIRDERELLTPLGKRSGGSLGLSTGETLCAEVL